MVKSKQHFHLGLHLNSSGHQPNTSSASISPEGHKHYKAHSHVDTPHPVLEHSTSKSSVESAESTGSYMDVHKHRHNAQNFVEQLPNPIAITSHTIQDHITELHYGHMAREAKKEAQRLSSQSPHSWKQGIPLAKSDSIPEYVEEVQDWKERDAELWAKELQKRERARRMTGGSQLS